MPKEFTGIRMDPVVKKRLKFLSVEYGLPIGDVLEGLVRYAEWIRDPAMFRDEEGAAFQRRASLLLDLSLKNSGWTPDGDTESKDDSE